MFHRPALGEPRSSASPNHQCPTAVRGFGAGVIVLWLAIAAIPGISYAQEPGVSAPASPEEGQASGDTLTAVWANTGEDKVTQDETRAKSANGTPRNSAWDGRNVRVFGARNEVVAF